ncbi:MAG: hypothetical protein II222_00550, partial [Paraprevotella sp.]|nr:hypothetical protein [Paraprevotella sp.]
KRRDNIPGKVRSLEAEFMNVSQSQIGIYNTIGTRLEADLIYAQKKRSTFSVFILKVFGVTYR